MPRTIDLDELVRRGVEATLQNNNGIHNLLKFARPAAVQKVQIPGKDKSNVTTSLDVWAERAFMERMFETFQGRIRVFGEESLQDPSLDLSDENHTVAIVDMVDGTDLVTYGIWLWCSAIVFVVPRQRRILAAFVGDAFGRVYFATGPGKAYVTDPDLRKAKTSFVLKSAQQIQPNPDHRTLDTSFLCYYGQKGKHASCLVERPNLLRRVHRIYNFAGNPMMAKVADGTMSGVFELIGQYPHDVVAGAYIAACAGATLRDLSGSSIDLAEALCRPAAPSSRLRYVLCCTADLAADLLASLAADAPLPA